MSNSFSPQSPANNTKQEQPFFSVVIPTCNRADMLRQAIQSVLEQTFSNWEMIVVDDHSTDNTSQIVASFNDPRIFYLVNDRGRGGAGARNTGIAHTRGQWVAFLDDDDVWLAEKLDAYYQTVTAADSAVGLVYSDFAFYDFDLHRIQQVIHHSKSPCTLDDLFLRNEIGTMSIVAIRTDILCRVQGLDERFLARQDIELYVRVLEHCRAHFCDRELTSVRQTNKDRISVNWGKRLQGERLFSQKHLALTRHTRAYLLRARRQLYYAYRARSWSDMLRLLTLAILSVAVRPINVKNWLE